MTMTFIELGFGFEIGRISILCLVSVRKVTMKFVRLPTGQKLYYLQNEQLDDVNFTLLKMSFSASVTIFRR